MQAFINGQWVGAEDLAIPIHDAGFVLGATVTEQLRTFASQLFCLDEHLQRLNRSLEIVQFKPNYSDDELAGIVTEVAARGVRELSRGDDVGVGIFVTPGPYATFAGRADVGPTLCVYPYALPFGQWAHKYQEGDSVVISDVQQVAEASWPRELKCRSRMHYFLADQQAQTTDPGARAILLDERQCVTEASTANVVLFLENEGLVSPPRETILPGISLMTLRYLAGERGIPFVERDIRSDDVAKADELLLTSTSVCVLPAVRCDRRPIGQGVAGETFRSLIGAWNDLVGVDIADQARRFAQRG